MTDLAFTSSPVQERIMRIGIEARGVHGDDFDQLYRIALKTLKADRKAKLAELTTDIAKLFEHQRVASEAHGCAVSRYYYMAKNEEGKPEIFHCKDPNTLTGFIKGSMSMPGSFLPLLYRHENEWS